VIHPSAVVHPSARIGRDSEIGPYCIIGENVSIGEGTRLLAHVVVNGHTTIGNDSVVYPFATIGSPSQDRKAGDEIAYTTIGDRTTIREYVSINRPTGAGEYTRVGNDCLLLAYGHVAHNCTVGNHVTMSNLSQLAGHCQIEDYAGVGGMGGTHQFVRVGRHAFVGGYSKIVRDVPPYFLAEGNPAEVYGLNSAGLRRHGFAMPVIAELKEAYKTIYRSGRNLSQAIEMLRETVVTDEGKTLLAFLEAESDRGIMK
jgi:UDP-N-acetylglucosamine acyltransferase